MKLTDLTGHIFGRLTVLARAPSEGVAPRWICRCECGATCTPWACSLVRGKAKSCGCLRRELRAAQLTVHGLSQNNPLYEIWKGMRSRCNNPKLRSYANYGGRGIRVCTRWDDFLAFRDDMGPTFVPGLTIDRKDNDKGYSPDNCRWITRTQQLQNKRRTIWATLNGERMGLAEAARRSGLRPGTVTLRVSHLGWSVEDALSTPVRKQKNNHT